MPNLPSKEFFEALGKARMLSKRVAGIPVTRSDGSDCSINNDIQAVAAEYWAAQLCHQPFNATVSPSGDGGSDFKISLDVEVIWLGQDKSGAPRSNGHLIVNPHEPHRWADIYIVVKGSIESGFSLCGWVTHKELVSNPKMDFGYGERFAMNIKDLRQGDLLRLKRDPNLSTKT
jgi:hypothetical protein